MSDPIVSIVIPCYNDAQYISQSVQSAIDQTILFKEIIVVDDGSDKETKKVLRELSPKITTLITQENRGQANARNIGIKEARGEYILMLDSDDYFEPSFCEKAIKLFTRQKDAKIVTCYAKRFGDIRKSYILRPSGGSLSDFLLLNEALGTSLIRKKDALEIGGYDESMRKGFEDWEFFIRLLEKGGTAYVIPETLYNYRSKPGSTTTLANKVKYDLLKFIYTKHRKLYTEHYELFMDFMLKKLEREEKEKIKNTQRLEFRIGHSILQPFRLIKRAIGK